MKLLNSKVGDKLIWRHTMARDLEKIARRPEQLERIATVEAVYDDYVKTDCGDYFIENGRNMDAPCGCNRFCDCYGVVDRLEQSAG